MCGGGGGVVSGCGEVSKCVVVVVVLMWLWLLVAR